MGRDVYHLGYLIPEVKNIFTTRYEFYTEIASFKVLFLFIFKL